MGFSNIGTFACRAIQAKLIDFYGKNTAEYKTMGSISLLRWLLSPQNRRGFNQITDEITGLPRAVPGKKRAIAFQLDNPFCFDVCSIDGVDCTTEFDNLSNPTQEVVFDFDRSHPWRPCDANGDPTKLEFSVEELRKYCTETDTSYITRQIARYNKRFIEAFDKRMGELLETLVGTNAAGDTITSIPFFVQHASGLQTLNPEAWWWLKQNYANIGGEDQFGLVGGQVLSKINEFQKWANLGDWGIDLSQLNDLAPYSYYDRFLDTTLGVNSFFQLSPGAVQLVTFNDYVGEHRRVVTDLYTNGTFIDPATGLEVDFEWRFDYNCGIYTYKAFLHAELAVARPGGCGLPTSNGVMLITDCSSGATPPVCPESA